MIFIQLVLIPVLLLLISEISAIPTEPQEDVAQSLITPAAQLPKRQTSGSATCGYIDGDFSASFIFEIGVNFNGSQEPLLSAPRVTVAHLPPTMGPLVLLAATTKAVLMTFDNVFLRLLILYTLALNPPPNVYTGLC
jgi:hypothetical protein